MMNGTIRDLETFTGVVKNALETEYKDSKITVNEVTKNNGLTLVGISILSKESNLAPTVYLNGLFKEYCNGKTMVEVLNDVKRVYEEQRVHEDFNVNAITDFASVKDNICFKLINRDRNLELLKYTPHVDFNDLAVVFYILVGSDKESNATISVKNDLLNVWGITDVAMLYDIAKVNTQRIFRGCVHSIQDVMLDIVTNNPNSGDKELVDNFFDIDVYEDSFAPMFVATNIKKLQGSCVVLYDGLLRTFAEKIGGSFYVLPSSVHETLFVPANGMDEHILLMMVSEVNATEVSVDEFLSNHIYKYDVATDSLEMI